MTALESRLLALVAGTSTYPESGGSLPELAQVPAEIATIGNVLKTVYAAELQEGSRLNPSKAPLLEAIRSVVEAPTDFPGTPDPLVIYLSGHGRDYGGQYYLCTYDTNPASGKLVTSAVSMADLAAILQGGGRREIVLVIDACYAEMGVEGIAALTLDSRSTSGARQTVWGISAASRVEEAEQLVFAEAFADALRGARVPNAGPYLHVTDLVEQVNLDRGSGQLATVMPTSSVPGSPRVFRNPLYAGRPPTVPAATLDQFVGRDRARDELRSFAAGATDGGIAALVVTGASGAGKSTLLSMLERDLEKEQTSAILLDARGRSRPDLMDELFDLLGLDKPTRPGPQVARLQDAAELDVLLIDAPDTMDGGAGFLEEILRPMARHGGRIRLLLACREMPAVLRDLAGEIDLDSDEYFVADDLARLSRRVLTASGSVYADRLPGDVRRLSNSIREQSGRSFRMAGDLAWLYACGLATEEKVMPIQVERVASELLSIGLDPERSTGLLAPLAFAEGPGLPTFSLWLEVARRSTGVNYVPEELDDLIKDGSRRLITQTYAEPGQACWRMASDELAKDLNEPTDGGRIQAAFTDSLLALVPRTPDERPRWEQASEYTRRHLAMHAVKASRLMDLVDDPGFLLVTDVARTRRALYLEDSKHAWPDEAPTKATSTRRILDELDPSDRAGQLDRTAQLAYLSRLYGLDSLADHADTLPASWRTQWVAPAGVPWAPALASHQVGTSEFLLLGGAEGTVHLHRLGGETIELDRRLLGKVTSLAAGSVAGRQVAVAGDFDGAVVLYRLDTGEAQLISDSGPTVIGCAIVDDRLVVGTELGWTLYSADGTAQFEMPLNNEYFSVFATGTLDDEPVVVVGGRLTAWSLRTGEEVELSVGDAELDLLPTAITMVSSTGEFVVGYVTGEVLLFSPGGKRRRLLSHAGKVSSVVVVGEGARRQLLSAGHDGRVRRTPLGAEGPPAAEMNLGDNLDALVRGPSGWLGVAVSGRGGAILSWSEGPTG